MAEETPSYDSLDWNLLPCLSPNVNERHARSRREQIEAIKQMGELLNGRPGEFPFPKGELSLKLKKYKNTNLALLLDNISRVCWQLLRLLDQIHFVLAKKGREGYKPLLKKPDYTVAQILQHYVYLPKPCQAWMGILKPFREPIISDLLGEEPLSAHELRVIWDEVADKAQKVDSHLDRLRNLSYWNEQNYRNALTEFGNHIRELFDKLDHIGRLLESRLKGKKRTGQADSGKAGETKKLIQEPSKEANQAYQLCYATGKSQQEVAEIMSKALRRKVNQGQVSRWITQVKKWRGANGLPVDEPGKKLPAVTIDPDALDLGKRTDGRITGDPRHKANVDPDDDASE